MIDFRSLVEDIQSLSESAKDQAYSLLYLLDLEAPKGGFTESEAEKIWNKASVPKSYGAKAKFRDVLDINIKSAYIEQAWKKDGKLSITAKGTKYLKHMDS